MTGLVLDLRDGITAAALLGALVEVGASLESVEQAVDALGSGPVRLSVRGGGGGTAVRVFAPVGTPTAATWGRLRPHVAHLALEDAVVGHALATLDALAGARAVVEGCAPHAVEVHPLGGPDELAAAIGVAAALRSLDVPLRGCTPVGHGAGTADTMEGPVTMPGSVVAQLLRAVPTLPLDVAEELVDPLGAAVVAAHLAAVVLDPTVVDEHDRTGPTGRGRLPGRRQLRAMLD